MERNWKKWKGTKPLKGRRLDTTREQDKMGQIGDSTNEL